MNGRNRGWIGSLLRYPPMMPLSCQKTLGTPLASAFGQPSYLTEGLGVRIKLRDRENLAGRTTATDERQRIASAQCLHGRWPGDRRPAPAIDRRGAISADYPRKLPMDGGLGAGRGAFPPLTAIELPGRRYSFSGLPGATLTSLPRCFPVAV